LSEKKRINQIAKETGIANADLVSAAQTLGLSVKAHSSSVTADEEKQILSSLKKGSTKTTSKVKAEKEEKPKAKKAVTKKAEPKKAETKAEPKKEVKAVAKKEAKPKATTKATAKADDAPRTFEGKAVVEDPTILARIKAKEEAKLGIVPEAQPEPAEEVETPKAETKAKEVKPPKIEKETSKVEAKEEKKTLPSKPKIQIKVVKRAEEVKKEAPRSSERRQDNRRPNSQGQGQRSNKFDNAPSTNSVEVFSAPAGGKNNRRDRNKRSGDENRDPKDRENRPGGPVRVNDNRNQVRNARNSNWNKGGKGKRGRQNQSAPAPVVERKFHELPETVEYVEGMNVQDIAKSIKREPAEIIKKLFMMGTMVNQNQSLDEDTLELILMDYGITPVKKVEEDKSDIERLFVEEGYLNEESMIERPAVVTIMGHVDHGKTTLLDRLRQSRVTEGEAGGITQHIGAYQIDVKDKKITFLDTPGHEAFTSMRARGASVTDITILVVAADDGVMPQTIEAINHSKAAGVPIIVAINKIDKPGANPQRVIQELAEHKVMSQGWGGDSEFVEISAKMNTNIEELLETILLVAEVQDLKADPSVRAIGTVVEARLDQGKGAVATLLVQQGTLHQQDPIVVGNTYGRVRTMTNDIGRRLKEALPSTPVEITGLSEAPQAGDHFAVFEDEKTARAAGEERAQRSQLVRRQTTQRVSLDNLFDTLKEGQVKTVNVIIKADVQGTAEALSASLQKIEVEGVKVDIVHSAVGAISESDVALATASNSIIIGFNVRPTGLAREQAAHEEVDIRLHNIIYKVIEEVETAMKGMLDPEFKEEIVGEAIVRETFEVSKVGTIAGFMVTNGKVLRDASARVIREGVVIFDGAIASLKHFKDDVKEVGNAQEGGLMLEDYNDIAVDDTLEIYQMVEIKR